MWVFLVKGQWGKDRALESGNSKGETHWPVMTVSTVNRATRHHTDNTVRKPQIDSSKDCQVAMKRSMYVNFFELRSDRKWNQILNKLKMSDENYELNG